ncbi:MAG TPA: DNA-binding protein [Steroidobacteraceae bacterium]|jgi:hypothetical protein|nr:DNA-binding protein [Steroidobacteraceae bacterium]
MKDPKPTSNQHDRAAFSGRDVIYRDGAINALDVQRAADALLRQGIKPSVAALREQLGGGSPNTLTPLLAKYWETLGQRLVTGPEALERVPESLARVTELLWRRAIEEARERLKILQGSAQPTGGDSAALQEQILKLSVALAEAGAREGEQLTHLASLSKEREGLRTERTSLLTVLKSTQVLLQHQNARVAALEQERARTLTAASRPKQARHRKRSKRSSARKGKPRARSRPHP